MPPTRKTKVVIFLTPEAKQYLANEPLLGFAEHGSWFPCVSFQQNGSFVDMKVIYDEEGKSVIVEISIPVRFVCYALGGEYAKTLGFKSSTG